ncbi:MAG: hypothetical protein DRI95_03520 [Bacteroidetes bacterium]|nr:MAG: hypothetical protein DRI95_03520 [Bacteroidota bacterium]
MKTEVIIILISSIIMAIGIFVYLKNQKLLKKGKRILAEVVSNRFDSSEVTNGRTIKIFYPSVMFIAENGEEITEELDIGVNYEKPIGEKIKIIYDPENPHTIKQDNYFSIHIVPWLVFSMGVLGNVWMIFEINGVLNILIE